MPADTLERRLAAVLAADVVGYSRLMGADEEATLASFNAHLRDHFDPCIARHRGRVVKTTGDGLLAVFASVVDAVRCAAELQSGMAERNDGTSDDKRVDFRIGINVGDIVEQDDDIFGDGVNIAVRLEGIAEPGGICVSGRVQEDAVGKVNILFEYFGEKALKNISRPIRAYRLRLPTHGSSSPSGLAPGLPDKPSLAVLPFQNMSGDAEQDYFADGVVEDIITALSRFKSFAVMARNSSFVYKGRAVDVRQVSKELGVRYVLEGSVRRAGERLRITAQLVDGMTGAHLWASKFDGIVADIFDVQDQITENVVAVVEPEIREAEIDRSRRERPGSLAAYDLYLRALPKLYAATPAKNKEAFALLSEAIALEPDYGIGLSMAAWALSLRVASGWPPVTPDERGRCIELAEAALLNAHGDATILATSGLQLVQVGRDYDRGMRTIEQAVEANPNNLHVMMRAGIAHLHCGSVHDAMTYFRRAIRLSPGDRGGTGRSRDLLRRI